MISEHEKLVTAWISYHTSDKANETHPDFWATTKLWDLVDEDPEELWSLIFYILDKKPSDKILGVLSAGPLEELLGEHGEKFIDRTEEQARKNPEFRHLLGGVWKNSMTDEIWERIENARLHKKW